MTSCNVNTGHLNVPDLRESPVAKKQRLGSIERTISQERSIHFTVNIYTDPYFARFLILSVTQEKKTCY